jgi:hypothetical protein
MEFSAKLGTSGTYSVRIEIRAPEADSAELISDGSACTVRLEPTAFPTSTYSRALSDGVFAAPLAQVALERARALAEATSECILRVRVAVAANASELNAVRWEMLADPRRGYELLARGRNSSLARYCPPRWGTGPPEPLASRLRSVALVANPQTLGGDPLDLPPIDVAREISLLNARLDSTRIRLLSGAKASSDCLLEQLQQGCDVLYLACHGRIVNRQPCLYFEQQGQAAEVIDGGDLAERIKVTPTRPRLAVLASCQSAGAGLSAGDDGGFFASVAYQLIEAGVPAVIGMQGDVSEETSLAFFEVFFREALVHGWIELAAARARVEVSSRTDWWMPVLLLSTESGALWQGEIPDGFRNWDRLLADIDSEQCTPILGSGVLAPLSNREVADYFASLLRNPLLARDCRELPRVAQQLKVERGEKAPGDELEVFYGRVFRRDHAPSAGTLAERAVLWWRQRRTGEDLDPYRELASLPFPAYITANPDDLLEDALADAKKPPQRLVCPWKGQMRQVQSIPSRIEATKSAPLVYHLFGHLSDKYSVVQTEDDFLDHLIWISAHQRIIPAALTERFTNSSLLFLGFQLEDWEFRILLRIIAKLPSANMLVGRPHVAVQLDPAGLDQHQQLEARRGLEEFFSRTAVRLDLYWGTVEDFLRELNRRRAGAGGGK